MKLKGFVISHSVHMQGRNLLPAPATWRPVGSHGGLCVEGEGAAPCLWGRQPGPSDCGQEPRLRPALQGATMVVPTKCCHAKPMAMVQRAQRYLRAPLWETPVRSVG